MSDARLTNLANLSIERELADEIDFDYAVMRLLAGSGAQPRTPLGELTTLPRPYYVTCSPLYMLSKVSSSSRRNSRRVYSRPQK